MYCKITGNVQQEVSKEEQGKEAQGQRKEAPDAP
jgi:hypothetical protein